MINCKKLILFLQNITNYEKIDTSIFYEENLKLLCRPFVYIRKVDIEKEKSLQFYGKEILFDNLEIESENNTENINIEESIQFTVENAKESIYNLLSENDLPLSNQNMNYDILINSQDIIFIIEDEILNGLNVKLLNEINS